MAAESDNPEIAELQREVRRQGQLIDALARKLGIGQLEGAALLADDAALTDVVDAIRAGNKIEAIKRWRAHTNSGLREAKDAVESLARSLGA